jgi:CBS domain-containing membrane protein
MQSRFLSWLTLFVPSTHPLPLQQKLLSSLGAALGVGLTGVVGWLITSWIDPATAWLVAPIGASAVLVFVAPASPLAQPWSVVGGNSLSALTAIGVIHWLPPSALSAGLAVGLAILVMFFTRSLHPPGGACALLVVLTHAYSPEFAGVPVALNSLVLVFLGMLYHKLNGHAYPHRPIHEPLNEKTLKRDLAKVLTQHHEFIDMDLKDLQIILEDVVALHDAHLKKLNSLQ